MSASEKPTTTPREIDAGALTARAPGVVPRSSLASLLLGLLAGLVAGLVNLLIDLAAAAATLGFFLPLEAWHAASYAACGAALGLLLALITLLGRRRLSMTLTVTLLLALMQLAALMERIYYVLVERAGWPAIVLGGLVLVAGFAAWVTVLRLLLGPRRPTWPWALTLAAVTSAVGLAVNRNVVAAVLSRSALLADLAVVAAVALLAWILGRAHRWRAGVAGAAVLVAALGALLAHHDPAPREVPVSVEDPERPESTDQSHASPHLILVVVDTLRRDVFEAVLAETEEGRRFQEALGGAAYFDRAVAAAPWTAPSMASIMTGLWPPEHGYGYRERFTRDLPLTRLPRSARTLAERLEARGYATSAWVANPVLGAASGLDRGFERFELLNGATSKLPLLTVLERLGFFTQDIYLDAAAVRGRVESHLEALAADPRPDFLWIHFMDPHLPLRRHPGLGPDPAASVTGEERLYRDEVRFVLGHIVSMIGELQRLDLFDDAVFAFVSDHGEMFPSDGHATLPPVKPKTYGHGHALYDELVHVPLILRPPGGLEQARRVGALVSHVDLLPTFADLLGQDLRQPTVDRYSLAPWLKTPGRNGAADEDRARRPFALIGANHVGHPQRGLASERHKLIVHEHRTLDPELFDLDVDPQEQRNLAGVETARREEMARLLDLAWGALEKAEPGEPVELDAETREQLRALGYLD